MVSLSKSSLLAVAFSICCVSVTVQADPFLDVHRQAFGDDFARVRETLLNVQYKDGGDHGPEEYVQPGDVLIFLKTPDEIAVQPPAYARALEGFSHAALAAHDPKRGLYILDSYAGRSKDPLCDTDFRGPQPFVVVRFKKELFKSDRYAAALNDLAGKFRAIGYNYDSRFDTEVLKWSVSERAKFRADLMRWQPGDEDTPNIPAMYCSELPTTIYALIGILPKKHINGVDLIDIGIRSELASGRSRQQIVEETPREIIGYFKHDFEASLADAESDLKRAKRNRAFRLVPLISADIDDLKANLEALKTNEELLRMAVQARMGADAKGSLTNSTSDSIKNLLANLYLHLRKSGSIVRPIDFLKDALSNNGNFEIVGFYPGDMPYTCNQGPLPQKQPDDVEQAHGAATTP